jgi:hypothetical protein
MNRATFDPGQSLSAWVHAIAKYKLIDALRRRARRGVFTTSLDDAQAVLAATDVEPDAARSRAAARHPAGAATPADRVRPGVSVAGMPGVLAAPVLGMWILAAVALGGTPQTRWLELVLGQTAAVCPFLITLLAAPVLLGGLWALQGLAPTRLRLAGASAGLLAGAAGACVYAFHCPELAAPFLGTWYGLGMAIPTALGALIGPRVLRW